MTSSQQMMVWLYGLILALLAGFCGWSLALRYVELDCQRHQQFSYGEERFLCEPLLKQESQ